MLSLRPCLAGSRGWLARSYLNDFLNSLPDGALERPVTEKALEVLRPVMTLLLQVLPLRTCALAGFLDG